MQTRNICLKRYAVFTALTTFVLVWMGGLVTSHEAGLSVPDWPNTYGYNMFFFPFSKWIGGVFFEHTHRLVASLTGLLTTILALWLYGIKSRPLLRWGGCLFMAAGGGLCLVFHTHAWECVLLLCIGLASFVAGAYWPRCEPAPKYLRVLGLAAFVAVVAQGVLGGLRVTQLKDQLGIVHAALGQLFFLLLCAIALFQTGFWERLLVREETDGHHFRLFFTVTTGLILAQLVLGAAMRHQHAGLAIPDFPAAYGKLWPDTGPNAIARYNQNRMEVVGYNPITAAQVVLQMVHRILALVILCAVALCAWRARHWLGPWHWLTRLSKLWLGLVLSQVLLGAATIWTGKSADVATAHVACGALCLAVGGMASIVAFRMLAPASAQARPVETNEAPSLPARPGLTAT